MHHRISFFTGDCNNTAMAGGIWVVLVIPAVIAFIFGAWVFYSMVVDVSERDTGYDAMNSCVEGCLVTPKDKG
jgi:hypothetical protein